jgi:hypothetical protein
MARSVCFMSHRTDGMLALADIRRFHMFKA